MSPEQCARAIAANIRTDLVCCDAYDRWRGQPDDAESCGHGLCYWGEVAARGIESTIPAEEVPSLNIGQR
jgi:hypothetical protein